MQAKLPFAEDVNYWKTGTKTSTEKWMDDAKAEIKSVGGVVTTDGYMNENGRMAYALAFQLGEENYRIVWPVLPLNPKTKRTAEQMEIDQRAARTQAVTFLYHDVKAKAMVAKIFGVRAAFVQFLVLPGGETVGAQTGNDLQALLPRTLVLASGER